MPKKLCKIVESLPYICNVQFSREYHWLTLQPGTQMKTSSRDLMVFLK